MVSIPDTLMYPELLSDEFAPYQRVITWQQATKARQMVRCVVYERSDGRYVVLEPNCDFPGIYPETFVPTPSPLTSFYVAINSARGLLGHLVDLMNRRPVGPRTPVGEKSWKAS